MQLGFDLHIGVVLSFKSLIVGVMYVKGIDSLYNIYK